MENCFILKYYNIKILTNNVSTKLILHQVTVYPLRNLLPFMSFHEKDKRATNANVARCKYLDFPSSSKISLTFCQYDVRSICDAKALQLLSQLSTSKHIIPYAWYQFGFWYQYGFAGLVSDIFMIFVEYSVLFLRMAVKP